MTEKPFQDDPSLPPGLAEGLGEIHGRKLKFPPGFDQALLRQARGALGRSRRRRWLGIAAAVAAIVAVSIWVGRISLNHANQPPRFALGAAPRQGDKVNILTAYRLARALKDGAEPSLNWDRTGDGKIDQHDVDAWAADAVRIDPGGAP